MKILVTGAAGFIGHHTVARLLNSDHEVVGLDSISDYYDVNLKYGRLAKSGINRDSAESVNRPSLIKSILFPQYRFVKMDLTDQEGIRKLFEAENFNCVCHLAAQAGVRYSLTNPHTYIDSNITGFLNILEACRQFPVNHLVYASSSSVYGLNTQQPFATNQNADHPVSLYAASKKMNELMAHTYSHLYGIPATGLRFFTVYGPWGRPDMAIHLFTKAIIEERPVNIFNHGKMARDFTYIDDIVEAMLRVIDRPAAASADFDAQNPAADTSSAPYRVYNIGNNAPVKLLDFVEALEAEIGKKAIRNLLPIQPGDVTETWSDTTALSKDFGFKPSTPIRTGIRRFVEWYREYYRC